MPSHLGNLTPKLDVEGGEIIILQPSALDPAGEKSVWVRCTRHPFTKRPTAQPITVSHLDDRNDIIQKAVETLAACSECAFEREQEKGKETPRRTTLWGEGAEW